MKKPFLFITIMGIVLAGCSEDVENKGSKPEEPNEPFENAVVIPVPELSVAEQSAAQCQKDFGIKFFKTVNKDYEGKTMLASPLSASLMVSMVANTVDDELGDRICNVLGCKDIAALNSLSAKYMEWLPNIDKDVTVGISNSIWYSNSYTINPAFAAVAANSYGSEVFSRDFSKSNELIAEINSWTSKNTRGKIDRILDSFPDYMLALYINTLYFRGYWTDGFDELFTEAHDFYGASGTYKTDMMAKKDYLAYYSDETGTVVELPFGKERNCSMILLLPNENTAIDAFIASDDFDRLVSAERKEQLTVINLPKFKIEPEENIQLTNILEELGMTGFSKIINSSIFTKSVDGYLNVFQKTGMTLDEDGVEAAAATWTIMFGSTGEEAPTPKYVTFDRPFAFLIMENNTGLSLFAGKITDIKH